MKKFIWIVAGLVVVIGAGFLIGRQGTQERETTHASPEATQGRRKGTEISAEVKESEKSAQSVDDASLDMDGQAEMPAPQGELSDAVKALLLQDGKEHNYQTLLKAISELGNELSDADVAALMEMLTWPNDRFPEKMRPIEINAIKNDVLDMLLRQKELPEGIGLQMVEMAQNPENDPVWRDYCMQFMEPLYERLTTEYTEDTEEKDSVDSVSSSLPSRSSLTEAGAAGGENNELAVIHDAMFSALDERDDTIAGTALIGLENLSRTHDEFDREEIVAKASEIALDETASPSSRLTALRLASQVSEEQGAGSRESAVEAARSIAQTGETVLLRSAAIVTLGEVGSDNDRELLESYLSDDNQQIADAARMALAKMDEGQNQPDEQVDSEIVGETTPEPQSTEKLPPILIN